MPKVIHVSSYQYLAIEADSESSPVSLCICMHRSVKARVTQMDVFNSASLCWIVC